MGMLGPALPELGPPKFGFFEYIYGKINVVSVIPTYNERYGQFPSGKKKFTKIGRMGREVEPSEWGTARP